MEKIGKITRGLARETVAFLDKEWPLLPTEEVDEEVQLKQITLIYRTMALDFLHSPRRYSRHDPSIRKASAEGESILLEALERLNPGRKIKKSDLSSAVQCMMDLTITDILTEPSGRAVTKWSPNELHSSRSSVR